MECDSAEKGKKGLYQEPFGIGNQYRQKQKAEIDTLIRRLRNVAETNRKSFFHPAVNSLSSYEKDQKGYRVQLESMLGWPLSSSSFSDRTRIPNTKLTSVAEDELGSIYRVEVEVMELVHTYGLLFLPHTLGPHPLVIAQHGGDGSPELASGFYGPTNYNDMTRRVLQRGFAVFAPQLLLWKPGELGPEYNRQELDNQLKHLGGSIAALEIYKICRSLDYLISRSDIDSSRIGMIGLSYGGFYTLMTVALDTRIKAAYISGFINNRFIYDWPDFTWFNAGNRFLDAEICGLICPRPLYIESGKRDEAFHYEDAINEIGKVAGLYEMLGIADRFVHEAFEGGHELDLKDDGMEWLCSQLY